MPYPSVLIDMALSLERVCMTMLCTPTLLLIVGHRSLQQGVHACLYAFNAALIEGSSQERHRPMDASRGENSTKVAGAERRAMDLDAERW